MRILRSILPPILVFALLISTSGVRLVYHYCSGELDSVSLLGNQSCECDHDDASAGANAENAENPHESCPKDCCAEKVTTLQTTDVFVPVLPQTTLQLVCTAILPVVVPSWNISQSVHKTSILFSTSPPQTCSIPVLHRALLI